MSRKKKPIPKSKRPLDKNLFDGLSRFNYLNNPYNSSNLTSNFNFTTPQVGSPMGGSNPFGLSSLGNINTVTGKTIKSSSGGLSGADTLGAVTSAVSGTVDTVKNIADISRFNDYSDYTNSLENESNQLKAVSNQTYNASSTSDLLAQFNAANQAYNSIGQTEALTIEDLTGTAKENYQKQGKAALSGASAGAAIGSIVPGVGTLIGAGVGALVGWVGSGIGSSIKQMRADEKLEELNNQKAEVDKQRKLALAQQQANLQVAANNLQAHQANDIMTNYAALGGYLNMNTYNNGGPLFNEFNNGITIINEGGTHNENPYNGIQVGIDPEGVPNLVEEGEVIFNDYVFSNRLKVDENIRTKYKLRNTKELTFADAAKDIQKMSEEMPNDPIVRRTMELKLNQLMQEQEMVRQKKNKNKENNQYPWGGQKKAYEKWAGKDAEKGFRKNSKWLESDAYADFISSRNNSWKDLGIGTMQAAPIFGSLVAVGNDIFGGNEPDYTNVDKYETAINEAYNPIEARTLSDYIEYNPYDISFGLNKLSASQAASRRALANTTNNPTALRAAILASDYNYGNQIGEELRRAQEYNDANRRMVADFNRATNQYNAQAINAANQFNAQQAANKANALGQVAQWRDQIYNANRAEKSANLTGLYEGIAGLGETFMNLKDRRYLMDKGIIVGPDGKLVQISNAKGGKIRRIKNKRRLS